MSEEKSASGGFCISDVSPVAYAVLICGALITVLGYFIRFGLFALDIVAFSDVILYMVFFAVCAAILFIALAGIVGYLALATFLVSGAAILQTKYQLVESITLSPPFYLAAWAAFVFSALLGGIVLVLRTSWLPSRLQTTLSLIAVVLALMMAGYGYGVFREAGFYVWRDGQAVGYRQRIAQANPRFRNCGCGVGIIWLGDRAAVLKCSGKPIIVRDSTSLVFAEKQYKLKGEEHSSYPPLAVIDPDFVRNTDRKIARQCDG